MDRTWPKLANLIWYTFLYVNRIKDGGFHTGVGMEAIEGLHFLASLTLVGTGRENAIFQSLPFPSVYMMTT